MRLRLLALSALLAGCGTTVPLSAQQSGATGDSLAGPPGSSTYQGPGTLPGTQATTHTSTTARGGASAPTGTTGGGVTPSTTRLAVPATGPVEVGFWVIKDLGPATRALGVSGLATGNAANQVAASVAIANARGGLAGHPIKAVVFQQDATQDASTQYQAACGLFFDDHKVVAVVAAVINPVIQACSASHGAPFITSGMRTTSTSELSRWPNLVLPSQLDLGRVVATQVRTLGAQGFFKPRSATEVVKVGLLYNEDPDYAQVPSQVSAQLAKLGLTLADQQAMPGVDDTSRVAAASSAGQSAALKFAAAGVTHVLVVDKSGQAIAYFALASGSQGYYPVFGISSLELPASLRTVLSQRQLQGARGIGWMPSWDTAISKQPPLSTNGTACVQALTKAGEDMTLAATRGSALATCDSTLLLAAAWKGHVVSAAGFVTGLRSLGSSWPPVMTFADDFSSRRDGASRVRPFAYDAGFDCFAYTGPLTGASS